MSLPHLSGFAPDGGRQLVIDDHPTILLGGQVHNSTSSSPVHFRAALERIRALGMDTVLAPVSWELLEPREGEFDFSQVDQVLVAARDHGLHVVPLWFGAFKNAASTYAPRWVRADRVRFPRADIGDERLRQSPFETEARATLSVFSPDLLDADRAAFVALLRHLAEVDHDHTVVMVQVENEIGLLGAARDHSAAAEAAWADAVPPALIDHLTAHADRLDPALAEVWGRRGRLTGGTWAEVFGDDWPAAEVFMAWHFGSFVDQLAAAGKDVLPLPMYVNAWLGPQPGQDQAGEYPSGGPASRVLDVWKVAATSIDLLAPDIYVAEAADVLATYHRADNTLFVPESLFSTGSLFQALGAHRALGFSVFGAEDGRLGNQFSRACALLGPMAAEIAAAQADGRIAAVVLDKDQSSATVQLGGYSIEVRDARFLLRRALLDIGVPAPPEAPEPPLETEGSAVMSARADGRPLGLLLLLGEDDLVVIGTGLSLGFTHPDGPVEVDSLEEGAFRDGQWVRGRVLNGDERLQLVPLDDLGATRVKLLRHTAANESEVGR